MGVRVLNPHRGTTPGTGAQGQALALQPCTSELPQRREVVRHLKVFVTKKKSTVYIYRHTGRLRDSITPLLKFKSLIWGSSSVSPCLAPSLHLIDLRIPLGVRSHLLAKVDSGEEANGFGITHLLTSKEFFCARVVGMIPLTSRMRSILSLLFFGRAQPLLLSSCYLPIRASILRRQTPAAQPGGPLSPASHIPSPWQPTFTGTQGPTCSFPE